MTVAGTKTTRIVEQTEAHQSAKTSTEVPAVGPPLITITEVATHLGVQVRHVRRLVYERRIPYIKWGRLLRFDPTEIEQWLDACRHTGTGLGS